MNSLKRLLNPAKYDSYYEFMPYWSTSSLIFIVLGTLRLAENDLIGVVIIAVGLAFHMAFTLAGLQELEKEVARVND